MVAVEAVAHTVVGLAHHAHVLAADHAQHLGCASQLAAGGAAQHDVVAVARGPVAGVFLQPAVARLRSVAEVDRRAVGLQQHADRPAGRRPIVVSR